jgi:nucleotide-binding universal stress UspA family protein
MQRILIPCQVTHMRLNVIAFAVSISKEKSVPVHGFFLKDEPDDNSFNYPFPNDLSLTGKEVSQEYIAAEKNQYLDDDIKLFRDECENQGISYQIETDISIKQFNSKTSANDLVLTDTRADFLETLLSNIICPAYLVKESKNPDKVVLLYDGSHSSKQAVDKYISFFTEWLCFPTVLVSINESEKKQIEIEVYVRTVLQPHFDNLTIQFLKGDKEKELITFLEQLDGTVLVVMGAFGRSGISRFFHESLAKIVIENSTCSIFIAH